MRKKVVLPSILALAILSNVILSKTLTLENYPKETAYLINLIDKFKNDTKLQELKPLIQGSDEEAADSYSKYAEELDDMVLEGNLAQIQKEKIIDAYWKYQF